MSTSHTQLKTRIKKLNTHTPKTEGTCVLYMMSRDQRLTDNHALRAAQLHAESFDLPVVVGFALYPSSQSRSKEHVRFMVEGLSETIQRLADIGIPFFFQRGSTKEVVQKFIDELKPAALYFDFSPLRQPRQQQRELAKKLALPVFSVDTHNVVPVWRVSDKQEYAARTIRPKIHAHMAEYLAANCEVTPQTTKYKGGATAEQLRRELDTLAYEESGISHAFSAGESAALSVLKSFIRDRLAGYADQRNDPSVDGLSNISPYLHFGQLSSRTAVQYALQAQGTHAVHQEDVDAFIEEIVVRKELSDNYCYYNQHYDQLTGAPDWAQKTLAKHAADPREYTYTYDQFNQAQTHDSAWNAAQIQLTKTGKMHGYMRMYWAKKVLEWSKAPEDALGTLIRLNDFYSIDGGDPNGYVGILWAIGGLHDRPWQERPVYGTIRSMVYNGLRRKFDIQQYIDNYTK